MGEIVKASSDPVIVALARIREQLNKRADNVIGEREKYVKDLAGWKLYAGIYDGLQEAITLVDMEWDQREIELRKPTLNHTQELDQQIHEDSERMPQCPKCGVFDPNGLDKHECTEYDPNEPCETCGAPTVFVEIAAPGYGSGRTCKNGHYNGSYGIFSPEDVR